MSYSSLTINKQYDDNKALSEAQLDAAFASVVAWGAQFVSKAPDKSNTDSITGPWTFAVGGFQLAGGGVGTATLQYANTAANRTITFPDPGGSDSVVYLAAAQTLTTKTLTAPTISDPTLSGTSVGTYTVGGTVTIASPVITGAAAASGELGISSGLLQVHNGSVAGTLLRTDTYASSSFSGGNISIGNTVDGAFADVSAANASITFTCNVPGKYLVLCRFTVKFQSNSDTDSSFTCSFRLTDGTNPSLGMAVGHSLEQKTADNAYVIFPVSLEHVFTFATTGSKTVKIQKKILGATAINTGTVFAATDEEIQMQVMRIAD